MAKSSTGAGAFGAAGAVRVVTGADAPPLSSAPEIMPGFSPWDALPEPIPLSQDHGPITAGKWAEATARLIVVVDPAAAEDRRLEGEGFRDALVEALTERFALVQVAERQALAADGGMRLDAPLDDTEPTQASLDKLLELAAGKSFADHFARPEIQDYLRRHMGKRFRTVMHIERLWWCDRNPESNAGRAYKVAHQGG